MGAFFSKRLFGRPGQAAHQEQPADAEPPPQLPVEEETNEGYVLIGQMREQEGGGREGEEGRGGREQQGEGSEDENNDENMLAELREVWGYSFLEADVESKVGPCVALEKSYQLRSKELSTVIEQEYNTLFLLRSDVNALLLGFKQRLDLVDDTKLTVCFKTLRELVGQYSTLQLNEEAMQIVVDEQADEDAVEAVHKFNMMLEKCREFREKARTAKQIMKENLKALERESKQFQSTLDAIQRAKKQLEFVQEWGSHIRCIIQDTKTSSKALAPRQVTGSISRACV